MSRTSNVAMLASVIVAASARIAINFQSSIASHYVKSSEADFRAKYSCKLPYRYGSEYESKHRQEKHLYGYLRDYIEHMLRSIARVELECAYLCAVQGARVSRNKLRIEHVCERQHSENPDCYRHYCAAESSRDVCDAQYHTDRKQYLHGS